MKREKLNKKITVLHLHWGFPPIIGGVETHLAILLPTLVKRGCKVSLLTSSVEGQREKEIFQGVIIHRSPIMDLSWLSKRGLNGMDTEIKEVFGKFIEENKPDIIHAHNMHYFSMIHATILEELTRKKGIPLLLTAHNVWADPLFLSIMRKIKWEHIIAVSHFIKQELIGIGINHQDITTVHHGIDEKVYHPQINPLPIYRKYPQLKNRRVIFHPARMGLGKGCDVSVKALRIIVERFPQTMLVLAGTKYIIDWTDTQKKDIAYIVELVDFFRLRDNVLIDAYKLSQMPLLYGASEICIYPSSTPEPFGLTMLESMASGKPIVVTNSGGMPEIIQDGINGFVIPVYHFEELANRVIQLLLSGQLRERLGNTGRMMVEQHYTKEIMTNHILKVYKRFL